ncbi:MAG: hypothetical protein KDD21_10880 [Bacteroidetes bacterium]|nr:hypothetical protein [Bacteroidota bacterium]
MKTRFLIFSLFISAMTFAQTPGQFVQANSKDKLVEDRMEYIRSIKNFVGSIFWSGFSGENFPNTIVYFADSTSYFINPQPKMKEQVSTYSVLENEYNWNIWRMYMPLDTVPYVIETQFQLNPKSEKHYINYKTPVLFISSPELTQKRDKNVNSTQDWAIPVLHQLFRQYQYSNDAMLTYAIRLYDERKMIELDSLQGIYRNVTAYNDTLQKENELLKKAYAATSFDEEKSLVELFLKARANRYKQYYKDKNTWVSAPEGFWEKLEGTCMLMETELIENFQQAPTSSTLAQNDPMYKQDYVAPTLDINKYTDLNDKTPYAGITGFNMLRLLIKNKVQFKENFFSYASLSLDMQLKYFYKIK